MEELKNLSVWDLLIFLQNQVKQNAEIIKKNTNSINGIDTKLTVTPELLSSIKELTESNANLSTENVKSLSLFNGLLELYRKHGAKLNIKPEGVKLLPNSLEIDDNFFNNCLEKTIEGTIELGAMHPFISNKDFLENLLNVWSETEEYEKCSSVKVLLSRLA